MATVDAWLAELRLFNVVEEAMGPLFKISSLSQYSLFSVAALTLFRENVSAWVIALAEV